MSKLDKTVFVPGNCCEAFWHFMRLEMADIYNTKIQFFNVEDDGIDLKIVCHNKDRANYLEGFLNGYGVKGK